MKFLFLITALLFSICSLAEESQDLSKILADSHCVPVRGSDGNVSGHKCDGPLGEKIKEGKFQNLEIQKSQKMEIYSQLKKTSKTETQVQSVKMTMALSLNGKIVCLYGPEASGKTSLILQFIREAQKKNIEVVFLDEPP